MVRSELSFLEFCLSLLWASFPIQFQCSSIACVITLLLTHIVTAHPEPSSLSEKRCLALTAGVI
jgi:hypothetical protein